MKKSVALILAATAAPAWAAAPSAIDKVVDCARITDAPLRLACFDREVAPLAAQAASRARSGASAALPTTPATPSAPSSAAPMIRAPAPVAPPAAPSAAPSSFGQEQLAPERRPATAQEELTLHAHLTSQRAAGGGWFNLYLDNGQVWRHEDQIQGEYLRDGEAVTIEKGALGSYKLSRDAGKSRNWIRVTRIR